MMPIEPGVHYRATETSSLGPLAYIFILAFGWLACSLFLAAPWSYILGGALSIGVFALGWLLHRQRSTLEVSGTLLMRDVESANEKFDLSALASATYHWIPFYGSVVHITWSDGRTLEFPVNHSTRRFRAALRTAIEAAKPRSVQSNPESMRSLRRAGLA